MEIFRNVSTWLPAHLKQNLRHKCPLPKPVHIIFCICDHFEPRRGGVSKEAEVSRVKKWVEGYAEAVFRHRDASGRIPQYTFFYPYDEYTPEVLERVGDLCRGGWGEVELHLHHDGDTAGVLRERLVAARKLYASQGLLSEDKATGEVKYGFIHGNWALDNSRRDGRWCGVNNELLILKETGCYADFTLPSAPSDTQTAKINSIYYATDDPDKPKSHNGGLDVAVGQQPRGDLMLIQGPLALSWKQKKLGFLPRIENGELMLENPAGPDRVGLWIDQRIGVRGRPDWIFVKVFTHGLKMQNLRPEYFLDLQRMFGYLESVYNDGTNFVLHYVTARQMYNMVKAAEAGLTGDPSAYRDYALLSRLK